MSLQLAIKRCALHGIVFGPDLIKAGATDPTVSRAASDGRLIRLHQQVFQVVGAPTTYLSRSYAGTLAVRGIGSHLTSAYLWGLADEPADVFVSVDKERRPTCKGVRIFRLDDLSVFPCSFRHGIPCMNPMLTLMHMGAVCDRDVLDAAYDAATDKDWVNPVAIERAYDLLKRQGRNGGGKLRALLDERALLDGEPDSTLEVRMARIMRQALIQDWTFQYWVVPKELRVDFAIIPLKLAIEVDGRKSRSTAGGFQNHIDRQNRLVFDCKWHVLRFTWKDVVKRPAWVAKRIREVVADLVG